ncbi:MAG: hypothetical protein A4E69_01507 [Syntrophus sp. PtaB.Bin138]|nr:MAG: hypothetical protein A4E69_01507 [Syntrophus sp. PtaB.Bin138]
MKKLEMKDLLGEWDGKDPHREALAGIARRMSEETAPEPPPGLGERVMARIRTFRPSPWRVLGEALLKPRTVSFDPLKALRSPVSGQECSFYFIMVGIFYAVLGLILLAGLHGLGALQGAPGWVRWQPPIAIVTAGCMVAIGLYLLKDGKLALRTARIGALVYLGFALLNGVFVSLEWNVPVSAYVSLVSALIGLPTGFFLIRALQNCGKRYA